VLGEQSVVVLHQDFNGGRGLDVEEDDDRVLGVEAVALVAFRNLVTSAGSGGVSVAAAVLSGNGTALGSPAGSFVSGLNTDAADGARVLVGLTINTADGTVDAGAAAVLGEDGIALALVKDFDALLAVDLADVLVGTTIRTTDRAVVLRARRARDLGSGVHTGTVVSLLDVSALQQALVSVGLLVKTANGEVEVFALAVLVAGAGIGLVELNLSALKVALVVIGDTVLTADKLGVSGAVGAVLEVVRGALTLVKESLALASQDTLVREGFVLSGTNGLLNGGASTGAEAGSLRGDADAGADGHALVLVGNVIVAANRSEVILTSASTGDGGNNEVGGSTRSRADSSDTLSIKVTLVLVGDTILTANGVVDLKAWSSRISGIETIDGGVFKSRVSGGIRDRGSGAESIRNLDVTEQQSNALIGISGVLFGVKDQIVNVSLLSANWGVAEEAEGQGGVSQLVVETLVVGIALLKGSALEAHGGQHHENDRFVKHYNLPWEGLNTEFEFFRIFEFENHEIQI
jgi:hypothetical protein